MAELPTYTKIWHNDVYSDIDASRPELSVKGKTVVITGGAGGIGSATASAFATAGAAHVFILGRTEKTLLATKASLASKHAGTKFTAVVADTSKPGSLRSAFDDVEKNAGKVDVFINNAGYLADLATIDASDDDEWWRAFEINIRGSMLATKAFTQHAAKDAVLINVSTGAGHVPPVPLHSAYATSKLGSAKFFEYVQFERPEMRVYNLQPGIIESTAMGTKATAQSGFSWPQQDTVQLPANFMVWLASPEAAFLKGKFLWSNWDVKELMEKKEDFAANPMLLTTGLIGWPQ